jgi:hypothetical protein
MDKASATRRGPLLTGTEINPKNQRSTINPDQMGTAVWDGSKHGERGVNLEIQSFQKTQNPENIQHRCQGGVIL